MWSLEEIEQFEADAPRCCKCGDIVSALDTAVIGVRGLECSGCAGPTTEDGEGSLLK